MTHTVKIRLLLAGTALLAMAGPAFSLDGNDLLAKINAAMGTPSVPLAAQTTDVSGTTVILTGASYKPVASGPALPIDQITLDASEVETGNYFIDTVTFTDDTLAAETTTNTKAD